MQKIKIWIFKISRFLRQNGVNSKNRPNIKVTPPFLYKIIDYLNYIIIISLLAHSLYMFDALPDVIPVHFTWDGSADNWNSKYFIFLEIGVLMIIHGVLTYAAKFYTQYNYPVEITNENAEFQYVLALKYFVILKSLNVGLFSYIYYVMIVGAFEKEKAKLEWWFWIIVVMICSSTYIYKNIAKKSGKKTKKE